LKFKSLSELAVVTAGTSPRGSQINSLGLGFPFFQGTKEFGMIYPRAERFTEHPVRLAKAGDILIGVRAPVGEVNFAHEDSAIGRGVMAIAPNSPDLKSFLFYYLKSLQGKWNSLGSTGSVFENLSALTLKSIQVPTELPMKLIGQILMNLDSKIQSNIRISKTLESIAQTIFKSWFIDFDPVRAKMAGEEPVGMDAETAALFPDSMEESELGMIPSGWTLSNIRGICDKIINGSTPLRSNKDFWGRPDLKWFKTGELADGFLLDSKEHISSLALERTSVKVLPKGAVLMAIYAAPTVGRLGILTSDATFNQACTGMLAQKKYGLEFLYLNLLFLRKFFNSRAIGAAQQNISKVVVEEAPVLLGSDQLHLAFSKLISPIFAQIESLTQQNRTLAEIRDALLPRLISGELQIPDEMLES